MTRKPSLCRTVGNGQAQSLVAQAKNWGLSLVAGCFALSLALPVQAAGPKAGDLYVGLGAGLFTPQYNLENPAQPSIAPSQQQQNIAIPRISIGPIGFRLPVSIVAGDATPQNSDSPENRGVLSLNGGLGYQITDNWGVEAGLGFSLPRIILEGPIVSRVISNQPDTISIRVVAPLIIPINISGVYTFLPDNIISPFVGAGLLIANLDHRASFNETSGTIGAQGGFELGYVLDGGARFRVNDNWFGSLGVRYGKIDSPDLTDDLGDRIPVKDLEIREIRFGLGMTFPGSILPFVAGSK